MALTEQDFRICVALALVGLALVAFVTVKLVLGYIRSPTRLHKRADEGKLKCQADGCKALALWHTPHGYYCDWDSYDYYVLDLPDGGRVAFKNKLNYGRRGNLYRGTSN